MKINFAKQRVSKYDARTRPLSHRLADNNATLEKEVATLKTAEGKASGEKLLPQKDMDAEIAMRKKVEADNGNYKTHVFRQNTYGGFASVSARGTSPAPDR